MFTGLLIIIMALRYYYLNRPQSPTESFTSNLSNNNSNNNNSNNNNANNNSLQMNNIKDEPNTYYPCSPENFKTSLYEFYKSAQNYRELESELQQAQLQYEEKYEKFLKQHKNLSYHKERISQCVNQAE